MAGLEMGAYKFASADPSSHSCQKVGRKEAQ